MSSMDLRMKTDWSRWTAIWRSAGNDGRISSSLAITASTTATVLEPDCLRSSKAIDGLPSTRAIRRTSCTVSSTRATSPNLITDALCCVRMMRVKSETFVRRPIVRRAISEGPATKLPPGISMFWRSMAFRTCSAVNPYAVSRSGSNRSCICRRRSPLNSIPPTLLTVSRTCLIFLSMISVSSFGSRSEEIASIRIGAESGSYLYMRRGWVSRGN